MHFTNIFVLATTCVLAVSMATTTTDARTGRSIRTVVGRDQFCGVTSPGHVSVCNHIHDLTCYDSKCRGRALEGEECMYKDGDAGDYLDCSNKANDAKQHLQCESVPKTTRGVCKYFEEEIPRQYRGWCGTAGDDFKRSCGKGLYCHQNQCLWVARDPSKVGETCFLFGRTCEEGKQCAMDDSSGYGTCKEMFEK